MSSPTARTLAALRAAGITAGVVERFNAHSYTRHDLFGCIDLVAIQGAKIVGIQATSGSNHAARLEKSMKEPRLIEWLGAGAAFEVWSWSKRVAYNQNGTKSKRPRWQARVQGIELDDKRRLEVMPSHYPNL